MPMVKITNSDHETYHIAYMNLPNLSNELNELWLIYDYSKVWYHNGKAFYQHIYKEVGKPDREHIRTEVLFN